MLILSPSATLYKLITPALTVAISTIKALCALVSLIIIIRYNTI
jgi:hypothetical protein